MQRHLETYDDALVRQEREEKSKKRKEWEEIQVKSPELALFMYELNNVFGKFNLDSVTYK
jgi:hypothetical protein